MFEGAASPRSRSSTAGIARTISGPVIHQSDSCGARMRLGVAGLAAFASRRAAEAAVKGQEEHAERVEGRQEHGDDGEREQDRPGAVAAAARTSSFDQKPENSGKPASDSAPIAIVAYVRGMYLRRPPISVMSLVPTAWMTEPAPGTAAP